EIGWPGCVLYQSKDDGMNYDYADERASDSNSGKTYSILGHANPDYFDYKNKLIVKLNSKIDTQLETVSEAELFSGKNIAVVGNEIIQFKSAVLNADGTYTLRILLRGAFGTEDKITNHTLGERFILFDGSLMSKKVENYEIGIPMKYKVAAFGKNLADVEVNTFTSNAKNLRPLAPVYISGKRNLESDLIITWKRRARGYSGWRDYVDLPLIEKIELYEVEILDESNNVIRTINSLTSATYTYTSDQQIMDFGSVQLNVKVRIYQISDVVGRGNSKISVL
ncbi:hypothetical protein ACFL0U_03415, partial [Pseudomonadota bacterium]